MATVGPTEIEGETLEKAKRELNEDPETREQVIQDLRELIEGKESTIYSNHMMCVNTSSPSLSFSLLLFHLSLALYLLLSHPLSSLPSSLISADPELEGITFEQKDNSFLLRFLRARKFDLERSLSLYLQYHIVRRDNPDIFTADFTIRSVSDVLSSGVINVLDGRMNNGSKVGLGMRL